MPTLHTTKKLLITYNFFYKNILARNFCIFFFKKNFAWNSFDLWYKM